MEEAVASASWKSIHPGFFHKFVPNAQYSAFTFVITDLEQVWKRCCNDEDIQNLAEIYCPQLDMKTCDLIKLLEVQFNEADKNAETKFSITKVSFVKCLSFSGADTFDEQNEKKFEELTVSVHATLQLAAQVSIPFTWNIVCTTLNSTTILERFPGIRSQTSKTSNKKPSLSLSQHSKISVSDDEDDSAQSSLYPDLLLQPVLDESKFLHKQVINPLLGITFCLNSELDRLKQVILAKENELSRFREMYGSLNHGKDETFDLIHFDERVLKSAAQSFSSASLSTMSPLLEKLYSKYVTYELHGPSTDSAPATLDPSLPPLSISASQKAPSQQSQNSQQSQGAIGGGIDSQHEPSTPVNVVPSVSQALTVESQVSNVSMYQESENERKRKRELEEEMKAKRQKKEKHQEKKKIKKAFG